MASSLMYQAGLFLRSELRRIKRCGVVCSAVVAPESVSREVSRGMGRFDGSILSVDYGAGSVAEEDDGVVSGDELAVRKLGLPQRLVESLEQRGITQLFPIQRAVLIPALEGRDIIARAKTGTGKTLAFGIPILKRLTEDDEGRSHQRQSGRFPRVLVLAPTRELARQVEKEIKDSAPYLKTVCVYGGVPYSTQQSALRSGVDVVVGTPGRLLDLIKGNSLQLGEVQFLVLDEADQMLAVGFEEDVELILERLPSKRQSMLFSATMPAWVNKLARKYLDKPLTIDLVGDRDEKLAEGIKLYAIPTASSNSKRSILSDLIMVYAKGKKTIVFTQTKRDADEVSMALAHSIASEPLHGDITQYQRERTLNAFRVGRFSVLVATNVAARGLDIPNVDLVIHYELPNDAETFVHRSGRTGRAGNEGTVIMMFTGAQRRTIKSLERDVGCKFEYIDSPSVEQVSEAAVFRTTELPSSQYDGSPGSHYGRYNQRGGSGGGPRGRRGDSQSYGRNSSDNDGYRRGGSSFRTENSSLRSPGRPTRVSGSDRSDFGGSCFTCGRSGHKASDCPNKRAY